jgi:hypothetical protein
MVVDAARIADCAYYESLTPCSRRRREVTRRIQMREREREVDGLMKKNGSLC